MYKITIKNLSGSPETETIIYQSDDLINKFIEKPKLSLEWKQAGSLSFTVLPGHSNYDDINPMGTFVYAYWDNEELFYGRVVTVDKDLLGKKNIYCEGALSFLKDGEFPAFGQEGTATVSTFFNWCVNEYNYSTDDSAYGANNYRHFNIGTVDPELGVKTALFKPEPHSNPQSVMDDLLLNRFGGCFIVSKDNIDPSHSPSGHCLNYLKVVGNEREEMIRLCENVRDRTDHDSGESIFTVLRPLGANVGGDNNTPLELSTNNGLIEIPSKIAKYGRICKTVNFDDQDTEAGLRTAAEEYIARLGMSEHGELPKTCDIKYVDFHYLNPQIGRVGFGDVFADIEGYENQTMVVGHLELDLENPANDSMSLYNQTYLDAREYSALLESSTGAASAKSASRSGGGSGGSAIAKTLASATKAADTKTEEVKEHFEHKTTETNRELHDCYGIIGVKLDPDTHLPVKNGDEYVWGVEGTDPVAEIWGHFHRTAWETSVSNMIKDGKGNILSISQVSTYADGQFFVTAINDQNTGTAKINANRILIGSTSGSYLSIDEDGNLNLTANDAVAAINASTTTINANKIALNSEGDITLSSKLGIVAETENLRIIGDLTVDDTLWAADISADSSIHSAITIDAPTIEGGYGRFINLYCKSTEDQYGELTGGEDVSAAYKAFQFVVDPNNNGHFVLQGKTLANPNTWTDAANFNIAATQFYIDGVAAAEAAGKATGEATGFSNALNAVELYGYKKNASGSWQEENIENDTVYLDSREYSTVGIRYWDGSRYVYLKTARYEAT